jgi:hypothetical protein
MPFTFAHPAAVLPLKRCCPAWLSFPALIVGSISPDLAYLLASPRIDEIAHKWTGLFLFSLPAGVITVWMLHWLGRLTVPAAPNPFRRVFLPVVEQRLGPPFVVVCSVLIGAATHVFWDCFTHKEGWAVGHFAFLNQPLGLPLKREARVCHLLWYLSTFAGVTFLALAYQSWRGTSNGNPGLPKSALKWINALFLAVVMLPVALAHHLLYANFTCVAFSLVLVGAFIVWVEKCTLPTLSSGSGPFIAPPISK